MIEDAEMDVAVLGIGRLGRALAARLLEGGHRVVVWNRSKGKVATLCPRAPGKRTASPMPWTVSRS